MDILCMWIPLRNLASFRSMTHCKFWSWVRRPQIEGRGGTRGSKLVPLESVISVSYWLPIYLTKALSLTVFADPSNVTDRQNWYSNIQTSCCVRWRACIGRWKLFTYLKADIMFQIFCESATTKITILLSEIKHCVLMRCKQQPFLTGKIPILNCFAQINIVIDGQN